MAREVIRRPNRDDLLKVAAGYDRTLPFIEQVTTGMAVQMFDFEDIALDVTNKFNVGVASAGTTPAIQAGSATLVSGVCRNATGTTSGGASAISGSLMYQGQLNAGVEARIKYSAVTSAKFEVGFSDTIAANTFTAMVNVKATPSFNSAGDSVCWVFDTVDTANPAGVGMKTGTATAKTDVSSAGVPPVAATYQSFGLFLRDSTAYFYVLDADGHLVYQSNGLANAVASGVSLCWFVTAVTRNTTSKSLDIDYVRAWQRRTAA